MWHMTAWLLEGVSVSVWLEWLSACIWPEGVLVLVRLGNFSYSGLPSVADVC